MVKNILSAIAALLLSLLTTNALAQHWNTPTIITFDARDTIYQQAIVIDTANYHHNLWQIGQPHKTVFDSARSWSNAIVTDTLIPYPPNDTSVFVLGLRNYQSGSWGWHAIDQISFYYRMDVDTGTKGFIEYSTDTGHTWHLASRSYYEPPDTLTFTRSNLNWKMYTMSLFMQECDSILLKFTFISDTDTSTKDGWIIDDFYVDYWTEDVQSVDEPSRYKIPIRQLVI